MAMMRAFVGLRRMLTGNDRLPRKLTELERSAERHDQAIKSLSNVIRQLLASPKKPPRESGFHASDKEAQDGGPTKSTRNETHNMSIETFSCAST